MAGSFGRMLAFGLAGALLAVPARSAEIKVFRDSGTQVQIVTVVGELALNDGEAFAAATARVRNGAVLFDSPGGSVIAGLQIGQLIRLRHYATFSSDAWLCASACAIAWLAGVPRMMQPDSHIGFHAAFNSDTYTESGAANALVGAYFNKLGLGFEAVAFATSAGPDEIAWLTPARARELGIPVTVLAPTSKKAEPPATPPPRTAALPPPERPAPRPAPRALPDGFPLVTPAPPPPASLAEQARGFAQDYFAHWSEANASALAFFGTTYAPQVILFGTPLEHDAVMAIKRDYAARWPVRVYAARPASLRSFCDEARHSCVISGTLDWDCRSAKGEKRSTGTALFSLTVRFEAGGPRILAETGTVLAPAGG